MSPVQLEFSSALKASREDIWSWITSVKGITAETSPIFHMSAPAGVKSLQDLEFVSGQPLFRSRIRLAGLLPVDYSDLTLLELTPGEGFVEQSPMGSMKLWRHERRIQAMPSVPGQAENWKLTDRLTFEPRHARPLVTWFIRQVFRHRHAVLKRHLG